MPLASRRRSFNDAGVERVILHETLAGESDFEVEHGKVEIFQPILSPMKCGKKL